MYTLGYRFMPWSDSKSMADGATIREYIRRAAAEHDIEQHIRLEHRIVAAHWDSKRALWTIEFERRRSDATSKTTPPFSERGSLTCRFFFACSG